MNSLPAEIIDKIISFVGLTSRRFLRMVSRIFAAKILRPNLAQIDYDPCNGLLAFVEKNKNPLVVISWWANESCEFYFDVEETLTMHDVLIDAMIVENDCLIPLAEWIEAFCKCDTQQIRTVIHVGSLYDDWFY